MTVLSGRLEAVEEMLDSAERAFDEFGDEPYEPSVDRGESLVANIPAAIALQRGDLAGLRGDAERAITFAHRALAELDEGEWMLESSARWVLAVAERLLGRLPEAERALSSSIAGWLANGEPTLVAVGCHHLGRVRRAQGRLDAALQTYQQVLEIAAAPGRPPLPAAGVAYIGIAEIAYQRGDLDAALGNITEGIELCRRFAYAPPLGTGLAALAWIRQVKGDEAGPWKPSTRPGGSRQARASRAYATPSPPSGRGCCWPRATSSRPSAGRTSAASTLTTR